MTDPAETEGRTPAFASNANTSAFVHGPGTPAVARDPSTPAFAVVGAVNHGKSSVVATLAEDDAVRISAMPGETVHTRRFALRDLLVLHDTPGFQNARKALDELAAIVSPDGQPLARFREFVRRHRQAAPSSRQRDGSLSSDTTRADAGSSSGSGVGFDADFDAECRLLEPVLAGAGVIYVVDGSRQVREINRCEMEILRLTGAPRLAVINRSGAREGERGSDSPAGEVAHRPSTPPTDAPVRGFIDGSVDRVQPEDHTPQWKALLGQHFNAVRAFDAHRASFADRCELLEALANIDRAWKPQLLAAVKALEQARDARVDDAAALLVELLRDVLTQRETVALDATQEADEAARAAASAALLQRFSEAVAARERRAHEALIALFAHHLVGAPTDAAALFEHGLFSEPTWRLLGLDARQLTAAGAAAGAALGAGLDAVTAGHTLLAGSALGAAIGAGSAWWLGKQRPEMTVGRPRGGLGSAGGLESGLRRAARLLWPGTGLTLAGRGLSVGPIAALNFPWIVLDRALATFACAAGRAHARRDAVGVDVQGLLPGLAARGLTVAHWSDADRKACERVFTAWRRGKPSPQPDGDAMRRALTRRLADVAADPSAAG